jgi:hypothetical protein
MKRLAFLSFTIATLIAPIQVQAQTGCVRFPEPPNPEAELQYLLSHPGARVCPLETQVTDDAETNAIKELQRRHDIGVTLDRFNRNFYGR